MRKSVKRICSLTLALLLAASCVPAYAAGAKHERVFAVTRADGSIETLIDSVDLENPDGLSELTDRTLLTGITNVGGHETFTLNGDTLTWAAGGQGIRYQGSSDKAPAAVPAVSYQLDGRDILPSEAADASGRLSMTVRYQANGTPCVAVSVIPVPDGMENLELENAVLMNTGTGRVIAALAVPGVDERAGLPASFTVTCDADHACFSTMLTVAAADPLKQLSGKLGERIRMEELDTLLNESTALLNALRDGTALPELTIDGRSVSETLTNLLNGTASLSAGAAQVNDGAAALQSGTVRLQNGLDSLTAGNDDLNSGAAQLFAAILSAADAQLAASGLSEAGITLPGLTAENYAAVLSQAAAALEAASGSASALAREKVTAAVEARNDEITAAVTEAVRGQVLGAVLTAAGVDMTAETYTAAAAAGRIPEEKSKAVNAAVEQKLADPEITGKITAAVAAKKEQLIEEQMNTPEVTAVIASAAASAQSGMERLNALKAQLDSVSTFVNGLAAYTAGVSDVKAGVDSLAAGTESLAAGTAQLKDGAAALDSSLRTGLSEAAAKYLPALTGDAADLLKLCQDTIESMGAVSGYDLAAPDTQTDTVYVIRTVLNK